jgi:hypothetical protein
MTNQAKPQTLRVKSSHHFTSVQFRNCNYSAYIDGREEDEQGWGATKAEAVADLIQQLLDNEVIVEPAVLDLSEVAA